MMRFLQILLIVSIAVVFCACSGMPVIPEVTGSPGNVSPSAAPTPQTPAPTSPGQAAASGLVEAETAVASPSPAGQSETLRAMQRDIDLLVSRSDEQQGQESNYRNLKKEQTLTVESVTAQEIRFQGKPQVFKGDYTGRFTPGGQYKYFEDAAMGGKRYYNVKDNFGVWISFQYVVDIGQYGSTAPS